MNIWIYILTAVVALDTAVILGAVGTVVYVARRPVLAMGAMAAAVMPGKPRTAPVPDDMSAVLDFACSTPWTVPDIDEDA